MNFLKWLVNDIKSDWIENWEMRKTTMLHLLSGAITMLVYFSWGFVAVSLASIVVIKAGGSEINWFAFSKAMAVVLLFNIAVFIVEKLGDYKADKERLFRTLKE